MFFPKNCFVNIVKAPCVESKLIYIGYAVLAVVLSLS